MSRPAVALTRLAVNRLPRLMQKLPPLQNAPSFAARLAEWFAAHGKDYPWRRTTDPYAILVSEIMLQQTQIPTVLEKGYYDRWMRQFPDSHTLAGATEEAVLKAWEGLGYYRRARNLHRLAKVVVESHAGLLPRDLAAIHALPGIGPYTAGAVASFAYDHPAPIVDGNVARVLSRLFNDPTPIDSAAGQASLWKRATALVEAAASPRVHNSAIMELGQLICRPTQPACATCPVRDFCGAENPAQLPVKKKRPEITAVTERAFFLSNHEGVLLELETGSRRTGMWKLPALPAVEILPPLLYKGTYGITRYKVTLWVHDIASSAIADLHGASSQRWVPYAELPDLAMPSPYRRALQALIASKTFRLSD